ncbi:MAG: accessory gene regulator B family protein [Eubacterium sp.]|nr:accessory gene regulator B family protein [Eubacterium sp.]
MILSNKLSNSLVTSLCKNNKMDPEYAKANSYCLEQLFDLIIYHFTLVLIGAAVRRLALTLLYIITVTPTKMLAGGAHAKSRGICSILSYAVFGGTIFLCPYLPYFDEFSIIPFLPLEIMLWIFAPVCHPNKQLTDKQRKSARRILLIYFFILNIMVLVYHF